MSNFYQRIIRSGIWYYAGTSPIPVHIVRQNYDYFYEIDAEEGSLEPGEQPHLNADGEAYYILFGDIPSLSPWNVQSPGAMTSEEAVEWITATFGSHCEW